MASDSDWYLREKKDEGGEEAHTRLLEAWQAQEPMQRPTASLFVEFALSFLAHADAALLQCLLPVRSVPAGHPTKGLVFISCQRHHHSPVVKLAPPSRYKDTALLLSLLLILTDRTDACRVLWSGLLSQLASFPPVTVQQILGAIRDRVLSLGSDVPASLRAQPFSNTALAQVIAGLLHGTETPQS